MAAAISYRRLSPSSSSSRPPRSKVGVAFSLFMILACLTPESLARPDMLPADITSLATLPTASASTSLDMRSTVGDEGWEIAAPTEELKLRKRQDGEGEDESDEGDDKDEDETSSTETSKGSASKTALTISVEEATSTTAASSSPLPEPFDGSISSDFTTLSNSNCPNFLQGLLSSPTFESCYPLSMMLQTSTGFFDSQQNLLSTVRVLDATCAANVTFCTEYFDAAVANLTTAKNCQAEWKAGNSVVKQAYLGMMAYEMMYKASCLQTPDQDMYCFAKAVTNLTTASDAYFYFLPYNLTLPGSTVPSCNWCIQETMGIFHAAAADRKQYIAKTYEDAARQVNTICGSNFVNDTLPKEETSAGPVSLPSWTAVFTSLLGAALLHVIL